LADSSRITVDDVADEIERLKRAWNPTDQQSTENNLYRYLSKEQVDNLDTFDANQLNYVLNICQRHNSMASAGRELFDVSRTLKSQPNDSSRLQKYLSKFGLKWTDISNTEKDLS
jgi:transcriptional regulatory protein RtcR